MFDFDFQSEVFNSPGYLRCSLPEQVRKEVQNAIEKIDSGEIETYDRRPDLAGHLQKGTSFPITPKLNYLLTALSSEYNRIFCGNRDTNHLFHADFIKEFVENGYKFEYVLRDIWINYGKKYDFNPLHKHTGIYSFVLWVKIPYKFEDEKKVYPFNSSDSGYSGKFQFIYPKANVAGCVGNTTVYSVEWDLILFPSHLDHAVYPFYTSDEERISISGNLYYEPVKQENK